MLKESYPYYLANKPVAANTDLAVTDKYTGEVATRVARALAVGCPFVLKPASLTPIGALIIGEIRALDGQLGAILNLQHEARLLNDWPIGLLADQVVDIPAGRLGKTVGVKGEVEGDGGADVGGESELHRLPALVEPQQLNA